MLNWVSIGFLINLGLWYNFIFVCRIQCFIPFRSPDKRFSFSPGFNDLNHSTLFCFVRNWATQTILLSFVFVQYPVIYTIALLDKRFCFSAEPSDLYQSADLDKSFPFSSGSSDLYHSALWDKSFSFSACRIQWLVPYCLIRQNFFFFMAGFICA